MLALVIFFYSFAASTGLFYEMFYTGVNPYLFSRDQILNSWSMVSAAYAASSQFVNTSYLVSVWIFSLALFLYSIDLKKRDLTKDEKIMWFSVFIFSFGTGFLYYFVKYVYNEDPDRK